MSIERESKVVVSTDFDLPDLNQIKDIVLASDAVVDQHAEYFDTPDLRLTHTGASLRYRSDDGWTVKLPIDDTKAGLVRAEHSFRGDPESPPVAAVDLVRALIRTAPLSVVASVTTHRHRFTLTDPAGTPVAELDDDQVETVARDGATGKFREIEIELDEHAPARLGARLNKCVRRAGTTKRSRLPKVAHALGVRDVGPARTERASGGKGVTTRAFVQAVLEESLRHLIVHDPVIRIGEDNEGVHQARVATRKLRSDLRTFEPVLADRWGEPLRAELRWLGTHLGRARDADVLEELLRSTTLALPERDRESTQDLLALIATQRVRARAALLKAMRSARYTTLLENLVEATRHPQLRPEWERQRASKVVPPLALRQWRRLRRATRRLSDDAVDSELHKVRRRAKQARYALEAGSALTDETLPSLARRAEKLQEVLGEHQDRVVARQWLSDARRDQPNAAFVAGELAGVLRAEQDRIRADARRLIRRARKKHSGS